MTSAAVSSAEATSSAGSAGASASAVTTGGPSGAASPSASIAADDFVNPVLERNFADPGAIQVDGTWYAYATGDLTVNLQVASSTDLVGWERLGEALPRLPFWQPSSKGLTWAPEVTETSAGYVMYYTGRDVQAGKQCIALAVADDPAGPFVDESEEPLVCQYDLGGSIDPFPFQDADGTRYLLWKNDGNCCGMQTRIYLQEMTEDGLELVGQPVDLGVQNDRGWEGHLIEAPTLFMQGGTYYLFFSANDYGSERYAVGYATSRKVLGPFTDAEENPILVSGDGAAGPGGQAIVADADGDLWMLYHAWDEELVGDLIGQRAMWLDELSFEGGRPVIDGPEQGPQPRP